MILLLLSLALAAHPAQPATSAVDELKAVEEKRLHSAASSLVSHQITAMHEGKSLLFNAIEALGKVKDTLSGSMGELAASVSIAHLGLSEIKTAEKDVKRPTTPEAETKAEEYLNKVKQWETKLKGLADKIHNAYTALETDYHQVSHAITSKIDFLHKSLEVKDEEITQESLEKLANSAGGYKPSSTREFEL